MLGLMRFYNPATHIGYSFLLLLIRDGPGQLSLRRFELPLGGSLDALGAQQRPFRVLLRVDLVPFRSRQPLTADIRVSPEKHRNDGGFKKSQ